jgi:hypothetical protein
VGVEPVGVPVGVSVGHGATDRASVRIMVPAFGQGDQIVLIVAHWAIVYFGLFFFKEVSQILGILFSTIPVWYVLI